MFTSSFLPALASIGAIASQQWFARLTDSAVLEMFVLYGIADGHTYPIADKRFYAKGFALTFHVCQYGLALIQFLVVQTCSLRLGRCCKILPLHDIRKLVMSVEWLEPWWPTDAWTYDQRDGFARQLKLEVGPEHPLFNVPARLVGGHGGCDDALFELLDDSGRFAVVHLTWAHSQERMPWPGHEIFDSFDTFAITRMREDHDEYNL